MDKVHLKKEGDEFLLYFEGEFWKKVHKSVLAKGCNALYLAQSFKEAQDAFLQIEEKAAKDFVIKWLSVRSLFSLDLKKKLQERGISREVIEKTIVFCEKLGFIDDKKLAERKLSQDLSKGRGVSLALYKLRQSVDPDNLPLEFLQIKDLEKDALLTYLKKKKIKPGLSLFSKEEKNKLFLSLLRRGFAKENIQAALEEY